MLEATYLGGILRSFSSIASLGLSTEYKILVLSGTVSLLLRVVTILVVISLPLLVLKETSRVQSCLVFLFT